MNQFKMLSVSYSTEIQLNQDAAAVSYTETELNPDVLRVFYTEIGLN